MKSELISICIPTYNGEKFLQEALDSVKIQTYKNIEVIVSDDQSKDNTLEIIKNFKNEVDFPVHIYSHQPNGIGANWNNSIEKANGEYIKLLFQDDILVPNCIEVMLEYLQNNELDIVISKRNIINNKSEIITNGNWYNNYGDLQKPAELTINNFLIFKNETINEINFKRFIANNIFGEPCVSLFSKKLYNKVGKYNTNLKQILDYTYYLDVLKFYNIGIIEEKLISFRVHDEQASYTNSNNDINENKILIKYIMKLFFWQLNNSNKIIILKAKYIKLYNFLLNLKYSKK